MERLRVAGRYITSAVPFARRTANERPNPSPYTAGERRRIMPTASPAGAKRKPSLIHRERFLPELVGPFLDRLPDRAADAIHIEPQVGEQLAALGVFHEAIRQAEADDVAGIEACR